MAKDLGDTIMLKLITEGEGWAGRVKQQIKAWAAAGMSEEEIIKKLKIDFSPSGATFETIVNSFGAATGAAVDYVSIEEMHAQWKGPDEWMWVTVNDANRCEDCADREGQRNTWAGWEAMGLPGMGTTVCGWRCRCTLVPQEIVTEQVYKKGW